MTSHKDFSIQHESRAFTVVLFVARSLNIRKKTKSQFNEILQFDDTEFRLKLSCSCGVIWL